MSFWCLTVFFFLVSKIISSHRHGNYQKIAKTTFLHHRLHKNELRASTCTEVSEPHEGNKSKFALKKIKIVLAQHGLSPDVEPNPLKDVQPLLAAAAAYRGRDRNRSKDNLDRSRDSSSQDMSKADLRDSLLGQALEAGTTLSVTQVV